MEISDIAEKACTKEIKIRVMKFQDERIEDQLSLCYSLGFQFWKRWFLSIDIHYWIGKDTSQDEAGTAAVKTVELDAALGGRAVQHREVQGYESDKFLSYFKPCIIPLEGGIASGFHKPEEEKFQNRLYVCRGKRVVRVKQVPFVRSSLNHDDVFILDTENKIYQFNGANSNVQERAKSLEVIQHLKEKYHEGKCDVAIIDDGKLVAESDSGEFWVLFGGFAPIGKKPAGEDDVALEKSPPNLYSINDGQLKLEEGSLSKSMLENNKCYILDCGAEVYVWVGRVTQIEERKAACRAAEELIINENRSKATQIIQIIQGYETHSFKSKFESWPLGASTGNSGAEEGRGKVAGRDKNAPVSEDIPPLLEGGGKVEVWRINGSAKTPLPKEEIGKFYGGDCYIVLYTYHSGDKKEEYFLACWIGKESIQDDQLMAARLANTMWTSMKARPVQGRIFQGKEPPQFIALFQPMVVLKGGMSTGYKKSVAEKTGDETDPSDSIALIRVSGTSVHNNKAVQVDAVAASLNSYDCFLLQSGTSLFLWQGNSSTFEQHHWATKIAEFLKPGVVLKHAKEGTESSAFWSALGGKQGFSSKRVAPDIARDPHLYAFSLNKEKIEVTEVFNFSQDDLLTEDMLILDTHAENPRKSKKAFEIGQKYVELAVCLEGLASDVPLYKVTEGNEPCFFTAYFSWDATKAAVHGNSFEKKLALLFGNIFHISESTDKSNSTNQGGPTQRASALAALSSAFNPSAKSNITNTKPIRTTKGGSQRAAAVAALSSVLTAEQKKSESEDSLKIETATSEAGDTGESESENNGRDEESNPDSNIEEHGDESTYSYERLKAKSRKPVTGIDYKRREAYLSDEEFRSVFGMTKQAFYQQPKWKQDMQKRKVDLF
ncbi:hypothetical protein HPP92_006471 [Vanilla planifolia]|uniref:HP domain-containing protein n=1 Tax=Vanilla planifolia TaxID=51239 RepID=A0A835V9P2_VANPL|nr:hypothetical protein HPP92_006471 [Vanilla planifolia]